MTQSRFYHSRAWCKLSRAFLMSKNYICERCGQPAEIAHHRIHLTADNLNNPDIALNPDNLEALCQSCHNAEHFGLGGAVAKGLAFDENGNLIETAQYDPMKQGVTHNNTNTNATNTNTTNTNTNNNRHHESEVIHHE